VVIHKSLSILLVVQNSISMLLVIHKSISMLVVIHNGISMLVLMTFQNISRAVNIKMDIPIMIMMYTEC
jgi:hypothetical protein